MTSGISKFTYNFEEFVEDNDNFGQNGQITPIFEIFCKKTLFRNYIGKYHFLWYSSFLNSSSQKFCHHGNAEVEIWQLKKIVRYSSMVNSSTMQHNTQVYQARVTFYNKMLFFYFLYFISMVLKLTKLEYLVIFFFFLGLSTNKHKHKISIFFTFLFI